MRKILIILVLFLIIGCSQKIHWDKPGTTEQEFHKDVSDCMSKCGEAAGDRGCVKAFQDVYDSCMMGKGYKMIKK